MYHGQSTFQPCVFRNQAALGSADLQDGYSVVASGVNIRLWRWVDWVFSERAVEVCPIIVAGWHHFRVRWYNMLGNVCQVELHVEIFWEIAGVWEKMGDTLIDSHPYFASSSRNRCGFRSTTSSSWPRWIDNTEIHGPP